MIFLDDDQEKSLFKNWSHDEGVLAKCQRSIMMTSFAATAAGSDEYKGDVPEKKGNLILGTCVLESKVPLFPCKNRGWSSTQ